MYSIALVSGVVLAPSVRSCGSGGSIGGGRVSSVRLPVAGSPPHTHTAVTSHTLDTAPQCDASTRAAAEDMTVSR